MDIKQFLKPKLKKIVVAELLLIISFFLPTSYYFVFSIIIILYLFFCFVFLTHNKLEESKPSIKQRIKKIGASLIILLSIIIGLFSLLAIAMEGGAPGHDIPLFWFVILLASPLIFISGIFMLQQAKWAWRLFLIILTLAIILIVISAVLDLQASLI